MMAGCDLNKQIALLIISISQLVLTETEGLSVIKIILVRTLSLACCIRSQGCVLSYRKILLMSLWNSSEKRDLIYKNMLISNWFRIINRIHFCCPYGKARNIILFWWSPAFVNNKTSLFRVQFIIKILFSFLSINLLTLLLTLSVVLCGFQWFCMVFSCRQSLVKL